MFTHKTSICVHMKVYWVCGWQCVPQTGAQERNHVHDIRDVQLQHAMN